MERKNELLEVLKQDEAARRFLKHAIQTKGGEEVEPLKDIKPDAVTKLESFSLFELIDHQHVLKEEVELEELQQILTEAVESKEIKKQVVISPSVGWVKQEWIEEWTNMINNDVDMVDYLSALICPQLTGEQMEHIKKVALLMLANDRDVHGDRLRLHILLYGPPGVGRSTLLEWFHHELDAEFVGSDTSKAGLKANVQGELTPGKLAKSHHKILCIDEFELFPLKDELRDSMEKGRYKMDKGKYDVWLDAELRVLAALNNPRKLSDALLDRFDFKFEIQTPTKPERKRIASKFVRTFIEPKEQESINILKAYMDWISNYTVLKEDIDKIDEVLQAYIDFSNTDSESTRAFEANIMRISYIIAKIYRSPLKPIHVVKAIHIRDENLNGNRMEFLKAIVEGRI